MANNQNNVQLGVELDFGDDSLRDLKKQLDAVSKMYETAFREQRSQRARGGKFSPGFLVADKDLKAAEANVQHVSRAYVRAQEDYENKSRPVTKRVAGWFNKALYGEKVQSSEDADKEHRKMERRFGGFHQQMHRALALSSHLAGALAPLPGGGVLHAGMSGAAGGYQQGLQQYEEELRKKGQKGTGVGRFNFGAGAAIGAGAASAGILLLAKAVSGAVQGSQEEENLRLSLGQAAGGDARGRSEGIQAAYGGLHRNKKTGHLSGNPFTAQEVAPLVGDVLRGGGGKGSMDAAIRAQLISGQGQQFSQLMTGLAQGGGQKLDASAQKLWVEINATGIAQGLKKGRIGELITGAMQVASNRMAGTTMGDPSAILQLAAKLGSGSAAFEGRRGFETIGRMEGFAKGDSSPMARALSLMQNGLGGGTNMVEAMRKSERGIFGEGGMGVEGVTGMVGRIQGMAGGDRDMSSLLLSKTAGLGLNEATELLDLVNKGGFGSAEFDKFKEQAKSSEEKAFDNMAQMNWKGINKTLEAINNLLAELLNGLGGFKAISLALNGVTTALKALNAFIAEVKEKGWKGALESAAERNGLSGGVTSGQRLPEGWKPVNNIPANSLGVQGQSIQNDAGMQALIKALIARGGRGSRVVGGTTTDSSGKMHFVLELKDESGGVLERQEIESVLQNGSAQLRAHKLVAM